MSNELYLSQNLKWNSRNRIFNKIREMGRASSTMLSYELQLSRPTVKKCLEELLELGVICENGFIEHTGGRRANAYSVDAMKKVAIGVDLTKNHITVIAADLCGNIVSEQRVRYPFSMEEEYLKKLGELVCETVEQLQVDDETVAGVGIAVPGLITEDHQQIFYGKILGFTGMTAKKMGKYIPYRCYLYNDADAAGYAEVSSRKDIADAFYICLSNNIGGSVLINHQVYKGEGPRSGEVGHMTIVLDGNDCYCGQKGCFETYCNATILSDLFEGDLDMFFEKLEEGNKVCEEVWEEYLHYLSIAANNVRMLFDCKVILGGYVGAHMEPYLKELKALACQRNTFEDNAEYLEVCKVKREALALGSALPFVHELWNTI